MDSFNSKSFTIHYKVTGTGMPLVLLHGFGEDGEIWNNQVAALQSEAMVIVPDIPGSGKSKIDQSDFTEENLLLLNTIEFYADVVHALLQHLQITNCILFGHSLGGYITLAFAEKYPSLLKGFGLIHSTSFADSDEKKENRRRGIALMEEYGGYSFLKNSIPNLFTAAFKKNEHDKVEGLIEKAKDFETKVLQSYYKAMIDRPNRTFVLKESKVPVLIIAGEQDGVVPLFDSLQQAHQPSICHIHILKQSAHMSMWEEQKKLNEAISDFIKGDVQKL
jgi:pimeloyl-ACP methyl ester carboxylesterase